MIIFSSEAPSIGGASPIGPGGLGKLDEHHLPHQSFASAA